MERLLIREMKLMADDFPKADINEKLSIVQRARENLEIMKGAKVDKETREMSQLLLAFVVALEWTVEGLQEYGDHIEQIEAEIKRLKKQSERE